MTETKTESRIAKVWHERVERDTLTESEIRRYCQAVATLAAGYEAQGARTNLTEGEAADIAMQAEATFRVCGYNLTSEHTEKGLNWMRDNRRSRESVGITDQMIEGFIQFRWVGVYDAGSYVPYWGWRPYNLPIWEIEYEDVGGEVRTHEYWWSPWQK